METVENAKRLANIDCEDRFMCKNGSCIALLCTSYKVFMVILQRRLILRAETNIGEYQTGKPVTDQLFILKSRTKCWNFDRDVYQLHMDFCQGYDNILTLYLPKLWAYSFR